MGEMMTDFGEEMKEMMTDFREEMKELITKGVEQAFEKAREAVRKSLAEWAMESRTTKAKKVGAEWKAKEVSKLVAEEDEGGREIEVGGKRTQANEISLNLVNPSSTTLTLVSVFDNLDNKSRVEKLIDVNMKGSQPAISTPQTFDESLVKVYDVQIPATTLHAPNSVVIHVESIKRALTPVLSNELTKNDKERVYNLHENEYGKVVVKPYINYKNVMNGTNVFVVKTLGLYKEYFVVHYSLPKLDMIASPEFAVGDIENYGFVTYRETALFLDENHSAAANKQMVATVVAHELAHQWFWQSCEIDEIFDAISYRKGASVIRMLQSYPGTETFQRALASYIKKYACSNAKTEDLWTVLEKESSEPVNMLMNSWTKQQGYPVVSAKVEGQTLEFEQSRFLSSGSQGDGQWIVPVTLCCGSYGARHSILFKEKTKCLDINELLGISSSQGSLMQTGSGGDSASAWIKLNVDQSGFYRVKYDEELSARLRHAIERKCLSVADRYGIVDDAFALCMACKQTLTSLLTLMGAFRGELDYTVLSNLITISYKVARIAADGAPQLINEIKLFLINLFQNSAERIGWDTKQGESHLDAMLRGELLAALAEFGHDETIGEATKRFHAFLNDRETPLLPPDIRRAAYIAVMQSVTKSNRSNFESLLKIYRETDLSQEKTRILGSLGSCRDPEIILEVLNFLLSSEVRSQDIVYGLSLGREGREIAWSWMKENWDHISKTFGSGFLITRFVSACVSPFSSFEKAKEVEEFFATRTKPSMTRTLKQSLERVHINAKWVENIQNEKHLADAAKELAYRKY